MAAAVPSLHVWVKGRVQGVGFRAFTRARAAELQLTGWVRNLSDGRVEARAAGKSAALEAWLQAVRRGPRFADVAGVEVLRETVLRESVLLEAVQPDTSPSDADSGGFRVLR